MFFKEFLIRLTRLDFTGVHIIITINCVDTVPEQLLNNQIVPSAVQDSGMFFYLYIAFLEMCIKMQWQT